MAHPATGGVIRLALIPRSKNISKKGPQISPLRCAPVEMTKGRAMLPSTGGAELEPFSSPWVAIRREAYRMERLPDSLLSVARVVGGFHLGFLCLQNAPHRP
jgi:hypothetical protein